MTLPKDNSNHDEKDEQPQKRGLAALKSDSASTKSKKPLAEKKKPVNNKTEEKKKKKLSPAIVIPSVSALVVGGLVGGIFWYNATEEEVGEQQEYGDSSIAQYEDERESNSRSSLSPVELPDYAVTTWEESVGDDLSEWQNHAVSQGTDDIKIPDGFLGDGSGLEDEPDADWDGEGYEAQWNTEHNRPMTEWDKNPESAPPGLLSRMSIEDQMRQNPRIRSAASQYPSRAEGYMNNPDQVYLEDGSLNPMYSFVLSEDIEFFFGHTVQRLLNPLYGGWTSLTLGIDNKNINIAQRHFGDMFSSDWFEENLKENDISALPVFANWENESYEEFGREWYGEMDDVQIIFREDSDVFDATIDVKYSRYSQNGSVEEKRGVLKLTATPNYESPEDTNNRYVITDAKLSLK